MKRRDRRRRRRGAADRRERQGRSCSAARRISASASTRRKPRVQLADARRGRLAEGRRGRDRQGDGAEEEPRRRADRSASRPQGPVEKFRISGLVKFGAVDSIGGATLAGFDLPTAQRLFDKAGQLDQIRVAAKPGVTPAKLLAEIRAVLPPGTQVRSGAAQATSDAKDTNGFLSFLQDFLLAFGGIALFVGSFVIANSLSITIAQRTREFATLRTLGASRRQVLGSVHRRVARDRHARLARPVSSSGSRSRRACSGSSTRSGSRCRTAGSSSRPARSSSRSRSGSWSRCSRACGRRSGRRACRRSPRCGRARRCRRRGSHRFRGAGSARDGRPRVRRDSLVRAVRRRARYDPGAALHGRRRAARSSSASRCFSSRLVRPLAQALGWPATRVGGAAGRLARDNALPEPAAHGLDRGRADDRPRARDARRHARGRDHLDVHGRGRQHLHRRTTRSPRRTTSRRSRRARRRPRRRRPGVVGGRERARRRGARLRQDGSR